MARDDKLQSEGQTQKTEEETRSKSPGNYAWPTGVQMYDSSFITFVIVLGT